MKHKYVLRNSLYLDDELQDYFNEMSKKGWRLDFVSYYYRFVKDEHVYKYQIDYTPSSSEYNEVLKECDVQVLNHYGEDHSSSGHLYLVRLLGKDIEFRNEVICRMAERGIACNVHYKPLPMMTAYKNLGFDIKDYPNAFDMFVNEVTLPLHTCLSDEQVEYLLSNFMEIINE